MVVLRWYTFLHIFCFFSPTMLNVPEGSPTGIRYCLSIYIFGNVLSDFCDRVQSLELTII